MGFLFICFHLYVKTQRRMYYQQCSYQTEKDYFFQVRHCTKTKTKEHFPGSVLTIRKTFSIFWLKLQNIVQITVNPRSRQVSPGGAQGRLHWLLRSCHASALPLLPVTLRCPPSPLCVTHLHDVLHKNGFPAPAVSVQCQEHHSKNSPFILYNTNLLRVPMSPVLSFILHSWYSSLAYQRLAEGKDLIVNNARRREGETYQRFDQHSSSPPLPLPLYGRHFTCQVSLFLKGEAPMHYLLWGTEATERGRVSPGRLAFRFSAFKQDV